MKKINFLISSVFLTSAGSGWPAPLNQSRSSLSVMQVAVGYMHSCALLDNGKVKCWGIGGSKGVLGLGDTAPRGGKLPDMGDQLPYVNLASNDRVVSLSAGHVHTCAVFASKKVKCWGDNSYGQLGYENFNNRGNAPNQMGDNLPYLDLGTNVGVVSVKSGKTHNCALFEDHSVRCWGRNDAGYLGRGDTQHAGGSTGTMGQSVVTVKLGKDLIVTELAAGEGHTCALFQNGKAKCWGANGYGQLGLGDDRIRGAFPSDMSDQLPFVNIGAGSVIRHIATSANSNTTCAVLNDGKIKCWGSNGGDSGGLGLGIKTEWLGTQPDQLGENLPTVYLGENFKAANIALGFNFNCAISDRGSIKCWGNNSNGQLGLEDAANRGTELASMGEALPLVQLGLPVRDIALGSFHACAILANHQLKCWGDGLYGKLGLGDEENRGIKAYEMGDNLPFINLGH